MASDYTARRVAIDDLVCPSLAPLFWKPQRVGAVSSWWTHVPFAHWLVHEARPRILVELGTHNGVSYSAFCQAVLLSGLNTRCHAVDTWRGNPQSGEYGEEVYDEFRRFHDDRFAAFSTLLRCTFDEALGAFAEKSIDVLHIDGYHSFGAVTHDFESWLPKLSDQAVVLLHDTNERRDDFGVWRLFEELRERYPCFEFLHGHGLGVLAVGAAAPRAILDLCTLSDPASVASVRARFATLGELWRRDTKFQIFEREARRQLEVAAALATDTQVELDRTRAEAHSQVHQARVEAHLQAEQARAEAHSQVAQARAEAHSQVAQARAEAHSQVAQARAEAQAQVEQVRAEAERACEAVRREADGRVAWEAARAKAAEADAEASSHRVAAIEGSTLWRATAPLRRMAGRFPRARKETRRALRVAYWSLTLQLPQRLRDRRAQQARSRAVAAPPIVEGPIAGGPIGESRSPEQARLRAVAESPLFNRDWYLARYPDVVAAGMDPAEHYVSFGAAEGRSPGPDFDPAAYLYRNPDVAAAGVNPVLHYVEHGMAEGRDASPVDHYVRWVQEFDTLGDADRAAIRAHIARLASRPLISVVVPVYETDEQCLREMLESVRQQIYSHWELCIADDASNERHVREVLEEYRLLDPRIKVVYRRENGHISAASNSALEIASGEFVALLDHDDVLAPHALYMMVHAINEHPNADVLYSDEDKLDHTGQRYDPYFKPDWNPELFYCQNFINHLGVYRTSMVRAAGCFRMGFEGSQDYDLALRLISATDGPIVHVPHVLYHWRKFEGSATFSTTQLDKASAAARRAIEEQLASLGEQVTVVEGEGGYHRVIRQDPDRWPRVSVIVPTRDHLEVLEPCINGLLDGTDYPALEILIADNESSDPKTEGYFTEVAQRGVRVLRLPGPFNFSRINNAAAGESTGEILLFLNNDTSVIDRSWLKEMIRHAMRPGVGAVGARLLYPNGDVQHAGVVLGIGGVAGHVHCGASREDHGYFARLKLTQDISCVTAACMAMPKAVFEQVGGFDENLVVAFNDVDLCIRIREAGYRIIWTPYAELYHHESKSRGSDAVPAQQSRFRRETNYVRERWAKQLAADPFFSPNLSLDSIRPGLAVPPRSRKPWLVKEEMGSSSLAASQVDRRSAKDRQAFLLAGLDRLARIVEIGPSFNPIAPKSAGWDTRTLDHTTRASLVEKYRGHPGVDVDRIEDVDFVWTGGSIIDAVPSDLHGTFDAFIASHVIEHTTDLVGFLDAAATLLTPAGVVILAVPDKRYCFDYFRPLTTTGDVLEAHAARSSRHTRRSVFNHVAYVVKSGGAGAWGQAPVQAIDFFHSIDQAGEVFSTVGEDPSSPYVDAHAWQFTPASFELVLLELARLGETDWLVERTTPATGCEFYAWLRRGGQAAAGALAATELDARRLELLKRILLQTKEQIDFFVAGEAARAAPGTQVHG